MAKSGCRFLQGMPTSAVTWGCPCACRVQLGATTVLLIGLKNAWLQGPVDVRMIPILAPTTRTGLNPVWLPKGRVWGIGRAHGIHELNGLEHTKEILSAAASVLFAFQLLEIRRLKADCIVAIKAWPASCLGERAYPAARARAAALQRRHRCEHCSRPDSRPECHRFL